MEIRRHNLDRFISGTGFFVATFITGIFMLAGCQEGVGEEAGSEVISEQRNVMPSDREQLSGADFVQLGELSTVSGELVTQYGEWFLQTDSRLYEIHLGNHEHRRAIGVDLEVGREAEVKGFIYEDDIAVVSMIIDNHEYAFRTEEGRPLWAGAGYGRRRDSEDGMGRNR